jgi:TPR repeat protein
MIKKLVRVALFIGVSLWAGLIEDGIAQARKGNNTQALKLFEKACADTKTAQGCFYSGQAYAKGTIVKKDIQKAFDFFNKSCELAYTDGCMVEGSAYYYGRGIKQDYAKAEKILKQACDQGEANGCFLVGSMYDLGQGMDRDATKALEYYSHACDYGSKKGCQYQKQMSIKLKEN